MNEQTQAIFDDNILGSLATVNEDGSPWSTPLHVVTDGEAVYWFSSESAAHSRNLASDNRASLTIFSPDESNGPTGVFVNGAVEVVAGEDRQRVVNLYAERAGSFPPSFDGATAYKLPIGVPDEAKSTGRCWYFYS